MPIILTNLDICTYLLFRHNSLFEWLLSVWLTSLFFCVFWVHHNELEAVYHWTTVKGGAIQYLPHSQSLVCEWRKKSLVQTVCTCSVHPGFLGIWKNLLCYTNLREARWLLLYKRYLALITLCVDDDEGVMKVFSSLLAGIVHAFVHSS